MSDPLSRLKKVVQNRGEIGHRWHRRSGEDLINFIYDDPDVQAEVTEPGVKQAVVREVMTPAIEDVIFGKNVEQHRATYGDELIDRILAASKHHGSRTQ